METTVRYNPIKDKTRRFFTHDITKAILVLVGFAGFVASVIVIVNALLPFEYAGLKKSQARNLIRQAIVNKYGIDRALTFTAHDPETSHVLGRTAWIGRWTTGHKRDVCVFAWSEHYKRISYVGRCPQ